MASSSDYLKQQLGFRVNGNDAVAASPRPGTPQYKPKEDMYDEIIELKKVGGSRQKLLWSVFSFL